MNIFDYTHFIHLITNTDVVEVAGVVVTILLIALLFAGVVVKKEEAEEQDDWEEHVEELCGIVNNISDFHICRINYEENKI